MALSRVDGGQTEVVEPSTIGEGAIYERHAAIAFVRTPFRARGRGTVTAFGLLHENRGSPHQKYPQQHMVNEATLIVSSNAFDHLYQRERTHLADFHGDVVVF